MTQCQNSNLSGNVGINRKLVELPTPFSWTAMQDQTGDIRITDLQIDNLDGSKEAANELLDFLIDKCPDRGLTKICFGDWKSTVTEVEPELLTMLAQKAQDIESLLIYNMKGATTQMKQELANLAISVIQQASVNLETLYLN